MLSYNSSKIISLNQSESHSDILIEIYTSLHTFVPSMLPPGVSSTHHSDTPGDSYSLQPSSPPYL